ncbi:MAG: hypothetical protein COA96_17205 [SAR86 cluster bacterium]|uniref:Glycosyl transferase family 1 domain-containing protein n=1 Tax=SAR86 cluster bacterium TaxID=2030880 RepID=A0A2A5AFL1_9GAMM|nr:MAG: hypothetical protein COA96_17205 [SAR86 cluster bacterium]
MSKIIVCGTRRALERNLESMPYEFIRELKNNGHQVLPFGFDAVSRRLSELVEFNPEFNFLTDDGFFKRILSLRRLAERERPEYIFCLCSLGGNGFRAIATRIISKFRFKIIVRVTSDHFHVFRYQDTLKKKFKLFLRNNIFGFFVMCFSDVVVCQHEKQIHSIRRLLQNLTKFVVAFQFNKLEHVEIVDLKELRLPYDKTIVYLGRVSRDKGVTDLLHCIVDAADLNINFIFAGEISNSVFSEIELYKEDKRIRFIGQIGKESISSLLSQCDGYITFSPSEGVSNSLLEACQAGCIVISKHQLPLVDYTTHIMLGNLLELKEQDVHKVEHPKINVLFRENDKAWEEIFRVA